MIAVDTNILVYAHRREVAFSERARSFVRELAEGDTAWTIPWPCVHEFLSVVTNPRIFKPPTALQQALDQVQVWLDSPSATCIREGDGYFSTLREVATGASVVGGAIHDARIAALCLFHGVTTLYSVDRDFSRFSRLKVQNPLV